MGGRPYRDIEACMDFVAKQLPYADVERAVCLGGSYGGYLALWIAGQPLARRFKALMAHAPPMFGPHTLYATDTPDLWQKLARGDSGSAENMLTELHRWDPARYADEWQTPLFLSHGAKDNRCSASVSLAAFTHCQLKGVESKLLIFPDENHFILKVENTYHWYKEVIAWMNRFARD